jgi:hypothetical protein
VAPRASGWPSRERQVIARTDTILKCPEDLGSVRLANTSHVRPRACPSGALATCNVLARELTSGPAIRGDFEDVDVRRRAILTPIRG